MLLRNRTYRPVSLARSAVNDDLWIAAVVVTAHYRVDGAALAPLPEDEAQPPGSPGAPPDLGQIPLWQGVSVTAAGAAHGPPRAPFVRPVVLHVGPEVRRLIVFGERRWKRGPGGELTATAPLPFDSIALSFTHAFGGAYDIGPGLFPGTDLPMPRLRVEYPWNPTGLGFYEHEQAAEGQLLPSIELPDQLVKRWSDRPEPGGFSPCPELRGMRATTDPAAIPPPDPPERGGRIPIAQALTLGLRAFHHAPGRLIFPRVPPGTPISLEGLGPAAGALRFDVPPSPIRVGIRRDGRPEEIAPALRSIHIAAAAGIASFVHAHAFHHHPARAPEWVRVIERAAA